jgi:TPR repeat protein
MDLRLKKVSWIGAAWLLTAACATNPCATDAAMCTAAAEAALREDPATALARLGDACQRLKHGPACYSAARAWHTGSGPPGGELSPFGQGLQLLEQGCALSHTASCWDLARLSLRGYGVPKSEERAAAWFERGCEAGDARACVDLGLLREGGRGGDRDVAAALELYRRACEAKEGRGCTKLGLALRAGLAGPPDGPGGVAKLEEGCALGFSPGCGLAAIAWDEGVGVAPDPARRERMLVEGAALGDLRAAELLAGLPERAAPLEAALAARCAAGDGAGCFVRGLLAERDPRDAARATGLHQEACLRGHGPGCGRQAERAALDLAVAADPLDLHTRGCRGGYAPSCLAVANAQERAGDRAAALDAFSAACAAGLDDGCLGESRIRMRLRVGAR